MEFSLVQFFTTRLYTSRVQEDWVVLTTLCPGRTGSIWHYGTKMLPRNYDDRITMFHNRNQGQMDTFKFYAFDKQLVPICFCMHKHIRIGKYNLRF
jgi:hypothetical protein